MKPEKTLELRKQIQQFVRQFGLMDGHKTPCGFPLSVSQVYALEELEKQQRSVTELAGHLHLERSSVSRLVDALVKEEFVRRDINEANRRELILTLTDKGSRVLNQVREQSLQFYEQIFGVLPDEDHALIHEAFGKLNIALSNYLGKEHPNDTE
ncbi:MarR family winged helix-turn-helix transcriptional regulator [Paenibacillus sp. S-38]|uniref:MarR family winged helix-turn-helix transcriptional regulator n=1 Tax=Paenibacillus sp. S-38 TaxID=3416710 RepID=UPI003CF8D25E